MATSSLRPERLPRTDAQRAANRACCPVCGAPMRVWRKSRGVRSGRSHCFAARPTAYVCPADEAETTRDERGHYHRAVGALHGEGVRVWQEWEIARAPSIPFGPVTGAIHDTQDMRRFFAAAVTTLQEYDWTRPGACCLLDDDEFPRGHVSIWVATAMEDG